MSSQFSEGTPSAAERCSLLLAYVAPRSPWPQAGIQTQNKGNEGRYLGKKVLTCRVHMSVRADCNPGQDWCIPSVANVDSRLEYLGEFLSMHQRFEI
jgi:hypothetical protein